MSRPPAAPTVSVIIPFYGDPAPALTLVAALRSQKPRHLHEIIVSDDCSPTPFPETPGVTIVRRRSNGGFAQAVNSGANAATGDLLLVLNSDLELVPGFVDRLVAGARPWLPALVSCPLVSPDGTPAWP
ncbi:glycosyltransferase family 2 protein, partial [Actinomyces sp. MRS3W]|uniref:glycosyltransferase family 2 protein n=1 Tax=Actinomyces sp. MRS3W TaxID=2800796 RepID=UPI0028FD7F99